jgi:glycosyltransferase involved in cell wall biosynthesis
MNQINTPIKPKVSVVICAYNAAHCISGILLSLQKQTIPQSQFEVLIINDGSTDNTVNVVQQAQNTNIRIVNKTHTGLSATRNTGINNATAPIVAIIDADCAASPHWIEEIIKETKHHDIVTGNTTIPKSTFFGDCISGLGYPGGGHLGSPAVTVHSSKTKFLLWAHLILHSQ